MDVLGATAKRLPVGVRMSVGEALAGVGFAFRGCACFRVIANGEGLKKVFDFF